MTISPTSELVREALISVLREENFHPKQSALERDTEELRRLLGDSLISSSRHWKEETLQLIDHIWCEEVSIRPKVALDSLEGFERVGSSTTLSLWKGDISQLHGDNLAIVNAANDQGLGCFVPHHRCIDNVVHRRAGPRLRLECEEAMHQRGYPLSAGTPPIVTSSFHLPCSHVIHVTGPQVQEQGKPTKEDRVNLANAYKLSLDAAASTEGVTSVAFPCISTGLFGFPQDEAAEIALTTVHQWLEEHPNTLEHVIFNVFTVQDHTLYLKAIQVFFSRSTTLPLPVEDSRTQKVNLARQWINDADAVLVCAGAGMSVKEGEMVYTNHQDFAREYPWFTKWGYKTAYEAIGLMADHSVPTEAKWAFWAKHMNNMRWEFAPNEGYTEILNLVKDKDHFVLTSNVDGCFERSGIDPKRIYTPQGEWTYIQCKRACRPDSVFEALPYLDKIVPHISKDGFVPKELIPKCPNCGGQMFGNVRGGDWYLHSKYEQDNVAIQEWMNEKINNGGEVAVVEIGVGFNTPTVTRFPVESFVRELGTRGKLIRINPTEAEVPEDLRSVAFNEGWQVLHEMAQSNGVALSKPLREIEQVVQGNQKDADLVAPKHLIRQYQSYFGHFNWRIFLTQLRD